MDQLASEREHDPVLISTFVDAALSTMNVDTVTECLREDIIRAAHEFIDGMRHTDQNAIASHTVMYIQPLYRPPLVKMYMANAVCRNMLPQEHRIATTTPHTNMYGQALRQK